ncbi:thioredoxin domain-containing protein [Streptomyces sp. CA-294286]|uniref:thioredoxin domain-containing protein n=1 Tax=Streptomyces sp. CA-294286 TaxID=3240070 RepID=UPI003D8F8415
MVNSAATERRRRSGTRFATLLLGTLLAGSALAGCGRLVDASNNKPPKPSAAPYAGLHLVPEKLAQDGTTIVVGDPYAPVTVRLYEDPRCPACKEFEVEGSAPALRTATEQRRIRTEYVFASFLDDKRGGDGSKRAVNALRAALEAGKFTKYHELLFTREPANPEEDFTTGFLLEVADEVRGLRGPAFDSAVKKMEYRDFVVRSQAAYDRSSEDGRGPGTPSADINGRRLSDRAGEWVYPNDYKDPDTARSFLFDPESLPQLLDWVAANPQRWKRA